MYILAPRLCEQNEFIAFDTTVAVVISVAVVAVSIAVVAVIALSVGAADAVIVVILSFCEGLITIFFQICMTSTALSTENMTDTPGIEQYVWIHCATVVMITAVVSGRSVCIEDSGLVMKCHGR